jgi:hypothetical protein
VIATPATSATGGGALIDTDEFGNSGGITRRRPFEKPNSGGFWKRF